MKPLEPPDSFHLQAAQGWCELHSFLEANEELEKIAPGFRAHPSVLEVRWQICANLEKWGAALDIASAIVTMAPDWASGWIYRASSLTELNRQEEAYETLSTAAARFPSAEIILYDLACACCSLKQFDEARGWLGKAIEEGGNEIKLRALDDPDLEPLWKDIGST
jgi:tetratricopeptide (TPR) repeat protein